MRPVKQGFRYNEVRYNKTVLRQTLQSIPLQPYLLTSGGSGAAGGLLEAKLTDRSSRAPRLIYKATDFPSTSNRKKDRIPHLTILHYERRRFYCDNTQRLYTRQFYITIVSIRLSHATAVAHTFLLSFSIFSLGGLGSYICRLHLSNQQAIVPPVCLGWESQQKLLQ